MQPEDPRAVQERIARFQRLGGVDLSRTDAEDPLRVTVEVGTANLKRAIFTFRCTLCDRIERSDQEMEPMCTGPTWMDEHPPEIMQRVTR